MSLVLAIDCSDKACSVALGDQQSVIEEFTDQPRQHAKRLLPMYRQLISASAYQAEDIDAIAIAAGPGSFTGLRIGFSFAQGLAFALNKPLISVSSLEALAASNIGAVRSNKHIDQIQVCLDARMGELYIAAFNLVDGTRLERRYEDCLIGVDEYDFAADYSSSALIGSGFALEPFNSLPLPAAFVDSDACINASALHAIAIGLLAEGKTVNPLTAEPVYLRREDAWKTLAQQKAYSAKIAEAARD